MQLTIEPNEETLSYITDKARELDLPLEEAAAIVLNTFVAMETWPIEPHIDQEDEYPIPT